MSGGVGRQGVIASFTPHRGCGDSVKKAEKSCVFPRKGRAGKSLPPEATLAQRLGIARSVALGESDILGADAGLPSSRATSKPYSTKPDKAGGILPAHSVSPGMSGSACAGILVP